MVFRLRPAEPAFFNMFSTMARYLVDGADLLGQMVDGAGERDQIAKRMREAEHLADETTHDMVRKLNQTFITPFDREDIYDLVSSLDDVMDYMEEAVDLILLYGVTSLPEEVKVQVETVRVCAQLTLDTMPKLRTRKRLDDFWIEINRLENTGDKAYRRIVAKLFSGEFEALEVMKLKDIVDSIESAIDGFEKVANIVEQIALKES